MITVKNNEMLIANDSSSFLARQLAAVAIAAETPHTDMSALITMFSERLGIFRMRVPNQYVVINTIGVTTQATKMPGQSKCDQSVPEDFGTQDHQAGLDVQFGQHRWPQPIRRRQSCC